MLHTLSLCPICYKKIPAEIVFHSDAVWMIKTCDAHGKFSAQVEKDITFFSSFYKEGTLGKNKSIIVHTYNKCNMACSWCYYDMENDTIYNPRAVDQILGMYRGYSLLLSGGEPTADPHFFNTLNQYKALGWNTSCITNMLKLADEDFFEQAMESPLKINDTLNFACSFQHPKHSTPEQVALKFKAMHNFEVCGVKPACIMFSIESLDELDFIKDFYDRTRGMYPMLRIRTLFRNWKAKGISKEIYLSDLYKAFVTKFQQYLPYQCVKSEHSNLYCLYMQMDESMEVSLSCAPSVEDVDYHQCSRPVYMLAKDLRCYPVPLAQIINEGISLGWKDGFQLKGD